VKARAGERAAACFDTLDAHLRANGPYLLGERPCAVDFQLTMMMRWSRNLRRPALEWTALRERRHAHDRAARLPSHVRR
jgi:glutathione S-transferase